MTNGLTINDEMKQVHLCKHKIVVFYRRLDETSPILASYVSRSAIIWMNDTRRRSTPAGNSIWAKFGQDSWTKCDRTLDQIFPFKQRHKWISQKINNAIFPCFYVNSSTLNSLKLVVVRHLLYLQLACTALAVIVTFIYWTIYAFEELFLPQVTETN